MSRIADSIMQATIRAAPPQRSEWARAMEAEFATLEHGRLAWALGCWFTMNDWRVQSELVYLTAVIVSTALLHTVWAVVEVSAFVAIKSFVPRQTFYVLVMLGPALTSLALGAYRPRRVIWTILSIQALDIAFTLWAFADMGRPFTSPADLLQNLRIMDLPFLTGYSIWVVTNLIFAFAGATLRRRFMTKPSA